MKRKVVLFVFIYILLEGCSHTQVITPKAATEHNVSQISASELETDEFAEEYEDEKKEALSDPLRSYNEIMTSFNDGLFIYVLDPISQSYANILHRAIRTSLANFIHNLQFPIRFSNNLLQAKFKNTTEETERFLLNTTLGIGGLFDPASHYLNIQAHNEDFGQTLGFYGVGAGFHVVLPLLGPSNVRDIVGLGVDTFTSPLVYQPSLKRLRIPSNYLESIGMYGLQTINKNALNLGAYETLKKDAMDLYPFLRDFYEQKRLSDIEE